MVVAVAKALEARRRRGSSAPRPATPPPRRPPTPPAPGSTRRRALPGRRDRGGEAGAVARRRRARARGARQLRRGAAQLPRARRARQLRRSSTRSTPTGSRARRPPPSRSSRQLGRAPDVLALPYGGGGNTVRLREGVRRGGRRARGSSRPRPRERATTIASAIRIAEPAHLGEVDAIVADGRRRARLRLRRGDHATRGSSSRASRASSASRPRPPASPRSRTSSSSRARTVVCVLTGHGLKDTAAVERARRAEPALVEPTVEAILRRRSRRR